MRSNKEKLKYIFMNFILIIFVVTKLSM